MPPSHRTSRQRVDPPPSVSLSAGPARWYGRQVRVLPAASRTGCSAMVLRDQIETWVDEGGAGDDVPG